MLCFLICLCWYGGLVAKSCPTLATAWTVTCQAPLSIGFSRSEYWSGLPFPSPGDLANSGIKPMSSTLQADYLPTEPLGEPLLSLYSLSILSILICSLRLKKDYNVLLESQPLTLSYYKSIIPYFSWFSL